MSRPDTGSTIVSCSGTSKAPDPDSAAIPRAVGTAALRRKVEPNNFGANSFSAAAKANLEPPGPP